MFLVPIAFFYVIFQNRWNSSLLQIRKVHKEMFIVSNFDENVHKMKCP